MSIMLRCVDNGRLVASFDPDFVPPSPHPSYPCGLAGWTNDPAKAMHFPDVGAALACWQMQSVVVPLRPDGLPNRPLSGYSMLLESCEDRRGATGPTGSTRSGSTGPNGQEDES